MKKFFTVFIVFMIAAVLPATLSVAQVREISCREYIATYAPIAVQHQRLYGIPASIKMAQGILESGNGNSELARKSNNHFGIKCKSDWTGDTAHHDDDEKNECFRKYDTIEESYTDHSKFLRDRKWYASLFELDPTDYKGWAYGLKKAGYATDERYPEKLIKIIDEYELYLLDEGEYPTYLAGINPVTFLELTAVTAEKPIDVEDFTVSVFKIGGHDIFLRDGLRYVVAREGETYESIAKNIGIPSKRLLRFNGKNDGAVLSAGEAVYIEKASGNS